MLRKIVGAWLLIILSLGVAPAQSASPAGTHPHVSRVNIAITYNAERAQTAPANPNSFWFQGAAVDANWKIWNSLGIAAQVSGAHASNIGPGVNIGKIDFLFGPRFTWQPAEAKHSGHGASLFGEFLLGGRHAFDTVIPTSSGTVSSATAFALQPGAGVNLWLTPRFGLRLLELDYVYSRLPNAGNSNQNDFRIATGVVWRFR